MFLSYNCVTLGISAKVTSISEALLGRMLGLVFLSKDCSTAVDIAVLQHVFKIDGSGFRPRKSYEIYFRGKKHFPQ